jgi:hypothetical protein
VTPPPAGEPPRSRWRDGRWRAALLGVVAAPLLLARAPQIAHSDLCTYLAAGRLAGDGEPAAAFDWRRLRARHAELHPGPQGVGPFLYSPLYLLPARALAALPEAAAARANRGFGALCLGLGLSLVLWRVERARDQLLVAAAFVVAHPVWVQLIYQNWTFALLPLVAGAVLAAARGRPGVAGLLWALAVHLKAFLVFGLIALWVAGRRRTAVAAALAAALLAAGSLPATGVESWARWGTFLLRAEAGGVTPFYNKVSLAATVAKLSTEPRDWIRPRAPIGGWAVRGLFWAALPLLALGLWRLRESADAAVAFTVGWILLAVPQIWDHTELLLFLLLPALGPAYLVPLVLLLALTAFYNGALQPLLVAAARGEAPASAVRLLMTVFPALNLAATAAVVASAAKRRAAGPPSPPAAR